MSKRRIVWSVVISVVVLFAGFVIYELDIPNWQQLDLGKITDAGLSTAVYAGNDEFVEYLSGSVNRVNTPLTALPEYVKNAFIAAEDARFYTHNGFDIIRIFGALWEDIKSMSLKQGASTITQQLIKLTHLSSEKTLSRKAQEAYLALQLERVMEKDDILAAYLNTVYFGNGAYGIEAAANCYFNKPASELTLSEAALLAGVIKSPNNYAPDDNYENSLRRRNTVLAAMNEQGYITDEQLLSETGTQVALDMCNTGAPKFGWYMDAVLDEAQAALSLSAADILSGGYSIYTAFNSEYQASADRLFENADNFPQDAIDGVKPQSAFIALDADTGGVMALIGGRSYDVRRGLDRALSMKRQPGSAIKPISSYAAAVDMRGYLPTSMLNDTKRTFNGDYTPSNASDNYYGTVTMREALSRSLNVATVGLAQSIGVNMLRSYLQRFGVTPAASDNDLALALGAMTYGVTPAELGAAYCALANGGARVYAHTIRLIKDRNGEVVYRYDQPKGMAVSAETAYILTDMLKTAASTGSAYALNAVSVPVAAKTGTSALENGNRDAWTVAYTGDIAVVSWMGFDNTDDTHMLDEAAGGGSFPARLCAGFIKSIESSLSGVDFQMPETLTRVPLDAFSLENLDIVALANEKTPDEYVVSELFKSNDAPERQSDIWETPKGVKDLALLSGYGETPVLSFTARESYVDYLVIRRSASGSSIIATLAGDAGETLTYEDDAADLKDECAYTIVPRHSLLYANGVTMTGTESGSVVYSPSGILNRIADILSPRESEAPVEIISEAQALFG